MSKSITEIKKEFEKKVNELHNADYIKEKPVYFGYRYQDEDIWHETVHTATDWGNVWSFIEQSIQKSIRERDEDWNFKILTTLNKLSNNGGKLSCFDSDILSDLSQKEKQAGGK